MYQDQDQGAGGFQRPKFYPNEGETWTCAKCGNAISDLPFNPRRNEDGSLAGKVFHKECLPPRPMGERRPFRRSFDR